MLNMLNTQSTRKGQVYCKKNISKKNCQFKEMQPEHQAGELFFTAVDCTSKDSLWYVTLSSTAAGLGEIQDGFKC